jgi:ribosome-associated protein
MLNANESSPALMTTARISRPPARAALVKTVVAALEDMKAVNVKVLDVRRVTDVSDCMVLASGNSDRHVRSIADRVVERAREGGFRPMGVEGERDAEWVLVDLNDVIVHVMLPRVREFYGLEELWDAPPVAAKSRAKPGKSGAAKKSFAGKKPVAGKKRPAAKTARPARKPAARPAGAKSASARPAGAKRPPRKPAKGTRSRG